MHTTQFIRGEVQAASSMHTAHSVARGDKRERGARREGSKTLHYATLCETAPPRRNAVLVLSATAERQRPPAPLPTMRGAACVATSRRRPQVAPPPPVRVSRLRAHRSPRRDVRIVRAIARKLRIRATKILANRN